MRVLSDAVCDFLAKEADPSDIDASPLVVSLHGPPGVGKTYFHKLAARSLYNVEERCPGRGCPGYKVLFGMDYSSHDVEVQHRLLQKSLVDHLAVYPQSLIVIEEYDKLDCHMRGFFRQMLQGNRVGGGNGNGNGNGNEGGSGNHTASLGRSIVVLESNLGYSVLHELLEGSGVRRREEVPMKDAVKGLKDLVFSVWQEQGCEDFSDSQKFMRSIDHVLPFYPLEKEDIVELFGMKLRGYEAASGGRVACDDTCVRDVVPFLVDKVEFDGRFPIEGGKEVNTVATGYMSRAFRRFLEEGTEGGEGREGRWRVVDGVVVIM